MMYLMEFFVFCLVIALAGVASNPSPYYGASGLVVCAGMGCGILILFGSSFVSLVLLLIYLGGMLVVFAYSVALASDPFPESLGDWFVGAYFGVYVLLVVLLGLVFGGFQGVGFGVSGADSWGLSVVRVDLSGVSLLYHFGGEILLISGWALLLTLFVVLELTRGLARGGIRIV